jgi:murein DD-endopeptidase MepM/ murein hydrolase activator NlpD
MAGMTSRIGAQITATPVPTVPPTLAPTQVSTLVPGPFGGSAATWTPPAPGSPDDGRVPGNFLFARPFAPQHATYWARNYSYGSTRNGELNVHHGLDFPNPDGTPILAAAEGTVFYAGGDKTRQFGPNSAFYGILVMIEHPFMYNDGRRIYTLYGHMRQAIVETGQTVKAGEVIGYVGATGVALGAHLHFEVRVGKPESYTDTRNPELWLKPYPNTGVIAGRLSDVRGNLLEGVQVEVQSPGVYFAALSYTGQTVSGDTIYKENFVLPNVPGGWQTVVVRLADGGIRYRKNVYVWPGQVSLVNIYLEE